MTEITLLTDALLDAWLEANIAGRGDSHLRRLLQFWQEMLDGKRLIWAAWDAQEFLGHITLQTTSEYPPFRKNGIPEIVDLWVAPGARRRKAGSKLLQAVVKEAKRRKAAAIGLGVGVTADYGAAHRLYSLAGFVPDGSGLWVQGRAGRTGDKILLDHRAILMWVKTL